MDNFADRLIEAIKRKNSCVCVGLDPRLDMIPAEIRQKWEPVFKHWNPFCYASYSITDFNRIVIDTIADDVVAVKPQVAFYEQYGYDGIQAFFDTVFYAASKGLIVIADVKRSDIASTAEAYAEAYLKNSKADAITVNPFLGMDSIEPFTKLCFKLGKGIFILLKTSNPGSKDFQDAVLKDGRKLYELVAEKIGALGKKLMGESGYSSIGAVVGATFPQEAKGIRKLLPQTIFLVPGYGAQGAKAEDLKDYFTADGKGVIVNASRSIIYAYKDPNQKHWQDAIKKAVQEMNEQINKIR